MFRFTACQGTGTTCTISSSNRGDVFTFPPAVVSKDRIDDINEAGQQLSDKRKDQLLIALNSGSTNDDAIDGGVATNDFHSSLYLMVDNHQDPTPKGEGLIIPGIGNTTLPGTHATFMRLPLSEIERTREWTYPDGSQDSNTRNFNKKARPIGAPRIDVTAATQNGNIIEVYYVTYVIYEPGDQTCDPRWYDEDEDEWVFDYGSTYEVTFRIDAEEGEDFNFLSGTGALNGVNLGDEYDYR